MYEPEGGACLMDQTKKYYTPDFIEHREYHETDLEEALQIAGVGKYQIWHCCLMVASLSSSLLEIVGTAFTLPAAACDLSLPYNLKGIITSVPNMGVILTAPLWGWAADSMGRKPVLLFTSAVAGTVSLAAAFTSSLAGFTICKFIASLFLSSPSSLGWAYMSEMLPKNRRDSIVLTCNGFLMMSSVLSPVIAWVILPSDWSYSDTDSVKPWRVLTASYALPLLITALLLTRASESPKFLMAKGKSRRALEVVKRIYSVNSGQPPERFYVTSIRSDDSERLISGLDLLRPPHFKWLALTGFLMFGVFSLLNGLFLLAPDTINKVMSSESSTGTICMLAETPTNQTIACTDTMSAATFLIMVVTTILYSGLVMVIYLTPLNKKTLLVGMYAIVGAACLTAGLHENRVVAGVALSALQLTALGVGPLTAYAVHLFPTRLRGTAVGGVLMCGRAGSVVGATVAGYLLAEACSATFYGFTALLFLCAALSLLLPKHHSATRCSDLHEDTHR
ncbi:hypothetical protein evm_011024 [Chilo suppressalis]|nr:hypothetical protein evm_011024 [Chilo suppressalis]